ncbi:MAG: YihA family ribosome biogenesis GTP-binding protein [Chitinophagales bacterium]|nr:YihA family ribosome biogenesis GTP-binding protein [Chitinophagales bacterium]
MFIKSAKYVGSYVKLQDSPKNRPEFAFIGRSNVGKSSLINMLLDKKKLAKTSNTPGKTQTMNYFDVNEQWYLVDLPGYGYAKVSKTARVKWEKMIRNYLFRSKQLIYVFQLIDIRVPPQSADIEFINWMGESRIPFIIVFTKADKIKEGAKEKNVNIFKEKLGETWEELPPIYITSSSTKEGREGLLKRIETAYAEFSEGV